MTDDPDRPRRRRRAARPPGTVAGAAVPHRPGPPPVPAPQATTPRPEDRPDPAAGTRPIRPPRGRPGPGAAPAPGPAPRPGTTPPRPRGTLDPGPRAPLDRARLPDPLLLLPLRIEYRAMAPGATLRVIDGAATARQQRLVTRSLRIGPAGELWVRFYPDDSFAEEGALPPTAAETAALARFLAHPSASRFPDDRDPTVQDAWATFVAEVGAPRAAHLFRNRRSLEALAAADPALRGGRICGLPRRIGLFAVTGATVAFLGAGAAIPPDADDAPSAVRYGPQAIDGTGWIGDFDTALACGMALRLTDPGTLDQAFGADWIVAVGLSDRDGKAEIEAFVTDAVAHGKLAFLDAGQPTNNAGTRTTPTAGDLRWFDNENAVDQTQEGSAELLGAALGISALPLRQAINSGTPWRRAAAAMMRVVGPILLDDRLNGSSHLDGLSEVRFIDLIADAFLARGTQAPLRIGDGAYGVVTLTRTDTPDSTPLSDPEAAQVAAFVQLYARMLRGPLAQGAAEVTLRLEPGDPDAAEKLGEILKIYPGGRRLDVADLGADTPRPLGCAYVDGPEPAMTAAAYLADLADRPLADLPDPTAAERGWPLLYRLARRSLVRNLTREIAAPALQADGQRFALDRFEVSDRATLPRALTDAVDWAERRPLRAIAADRTGPAGLPPERHAALRSVSRAFDDALRVLRGIAQDNDGTARLESLLIEVVDFFQYRLDAWMLGLAHLRLMDQRTREPAPGLAVGYFGLLGALRRTSATGRSDGYVQAPSVAQASAAAVMRSAYLRHGGTGALAIDLSSARMRQGIALMDDLRRGQTLSQALGLFGERWLRDRGQTALIAGLRRDYPITNPDRDGSGNPGPSAEGVFDGLALGQAAPAQGARAAVQAAIAGALDALSDLVMAEAVHHRTIGAPARANAWLQVLSGDPIPDRPVFACTPRPLQASEHRVSILVPDGAAPPDDMLALAEPGLAALAAAMLPDFAAMTLRLTIRDTATGAPLATGRAALARDLYAGPLDLMLADAAGLRRRALAFLAHRGGPGIDGRDPQTDPALTADLRLLPADEPPEAFFDRIAPVVRMLRSARPVEPADLQPIALDPAALDEPRAAALWAGAAADLDRRIAPLTRALRAAARALSARRAALTDLVTAPGGAGTDAVARACDRVNRALWAMRTFLPGEVLPLARPEAWRADPAAEEARLLTLDGALAARLAAARDALATSDAAPATLAAARAAVQARCTALRHLLGRDRFPVLPRFPADPGLTPDLRAQGPAAALLGEWPVLRSRLRGAVALAEATGWPLAEGVDRAAEAPPDPDDPRPESEAPRLHHYGRIIAAPGSLHPAAALGGLVVDEWTETRPAMTQPATLALNHDGPQAEAPNALLLCVPAAPQTGGWTETQAAGMVADLIAWMQVRAATTQNTLLPTTVLPGSNVIGQKRVDGTWQNRIPEGMAFRATLDPHRMPGGFEPGQSGPLGLGASGLHEIAGAGGRRAGR